MTADNEHFASFFKEWGGGEVTYSFVRSFAFTYSFGELQIYLLLFFSLQASYFTVCFERPMMSFWSRERHNNQFAFL